MTPDDVLKLADLGGTLMLGMFVLWRVDGAVRDLTRKVDELHRTLAALIQAEIRK